MSTEPLESPRAYFEEQAAPISFQELQKYFAKGIMVVISGPLDLIDVAVAMHEDDTSSVQAWMDAGQFQRAEDEHAKAWVANRSEFMAVTVPPWVLVKEMKGDA